jgi:hypothetical protein
MKNTIKGSLKVSLLAAILLSAASSSWAGVYIHIGPPAIRIETHEERHGYVWQSGYWRWQGERHQWMAGHYAREKHGQRWRDGRWDHNEHGYLWVDGRWER